MMHVPSLVIDCIVQFGNSLLCMHQYQVVIKVLVVFGNDPWILALKSVTRWPNHWIIFNHFDPMCLNVQPHGPVIAWGNCSER